MSGVIIDVDVNEEPASTSLANINKQLASLVLQAQRTNSILGNLKVDGFRQASADIDKTTIAFSRMGGVGSSVLNTIVAPLKQTTSLLTSLPVLLSLAAAGFAAIQGIKAFYKIADDLTVMQNRLRLVIKDTNEFVAVQHELYRISRESYVSNQNTVESYFALSRSLKSVGTSAQDVLLMTKTLQQTSALSGGSTEALAAGMMQFNQAMASGVLRGDEFNSIMENLPRLAQALAENLGIAQGKLRTMAEAGALSSDLLVSALRGQAGKIESEFKSIVITAEMGVNAVNASFANLYQSIVNITHSNTHVAAVLKVMADDIDTFSSRILPTFYNITQGFRNYIKEIDMFDAAVLTFNKLREFKISPFDVFDTYQNYSKVKGYIDQYRKELGLAKKEAAGITIGGVKESFQEKLDPFKLSHLKETFFGKEVKPAFNFKTFFGEAIGLAIAFGNAIQGVTSKFHWLIPDIRLPLVTIGNDLHTWVAQTRAEMQAMSIQTLMPFARSIEAIAETLSFKSIGDHNLERQWVDLFKSSSIKEFTTNLNALGRAGNAIRFPNFKVLENDVFSLARSGKENVFAVLRYFGILENRLLFVNNVRFDRAIEGLKTLGSIAKRVYDDVIFPIILPPATAVFQYVRKLSVALADGIRANFTTSAGEYIGEKIVEGAAWGLRSLSSVIQDLVTTKSFSLTVKMDDASSMTAKFVAGFKSSLSSIGDFLVGIFKGALHQIGEEISNALETPFQKAFRKVRDVFYGTFDASPVVDKLFRSLLKDIGIRSFKFTMTFDPSHFQKAMHIIDQMLVEIMAKTYTTLSTVERRIHEFGRFVENVFYNIYDKVVGHSYWPDMIDGVVDYTTNLFKSKSLITKFKEEVVGIFKDIQAKVREKGVGGLVADLNVKAGNINFGTIGVNLRQQIFASILAGFMLFFGNPLSKYISIDFFLSSIDDALIGIFGKIPDFLSGAFGEAVGALTANVVGGTFHMFETITAALPKFVSTFVSTLGPIGKAFSSILSFGPNNNLLYAIFAGLAAYAYKAKDGMSLVKELWTGKFEKPADKKIKAGDGVKDYLQAIIGIQQGPSKLGLMYTQLLGENPKLVIAGIAAISSAYFQSISLMEGLTLGTPLIIMGIFGKDAGGRMIREALKTPFEFLWAAIKNKFFTGAAEVKQQVATPIKDMMKGIMSTIGDAMRNAQENKDLYGAGKISFARMFLKNSAVERIDESFVGPMFNGGPKIIREMGPTPSATNTLKRQFTAMFEEVLKFKIGSKTIGELGLVAKDYAMRLFDKIKDYAVIARDAVVGLWNNRSVMITAVTNFVEPIKAVFKDVFSSVSDGFKLLIAMMSNKFVIFVALAAGIATMANAASSGGGALAVMGSNITTIIVSATALTAVLYTLGKAASALNAFRTGKNAFVSEVVQNSSGAISLMGKYARDAVMADTTIPRSARGAAAGLAEKEAMKRATKEIEAAALASAAASSAGFKAMGDNIKATLVQLGGFISKVSSMMLTAVTATVGAIIGSLVWMATFMRTKLFSLEAWMAGWAFMRMTAFTAGLAITSVLEGIRKATILVVDALGLVTWASFAALSKTLFAAWQSGTFLVTVLGKIPESLKWIGTAAISLVKFIKTPMGMLITAGITATGALGLWLFGPGNTLFDNLEYYKDKLTSILDMKPTSTRGKRERVTDLLPDQNIASTSVKFSAEIGKIDFSKLNEANFKAIEASAETTKEVLDRINGEFAKHGKLTHDQNEELANALKTQHEIFNSQPRTPRSDLNTSRMELKTDLLGEQSNGFFAKLGRAFGLASKNISNAVGSTTPVDHSTSPIDAIGNALTFLKLNILSGASIIGKALSDLGSGMLTFWDELGLRMWNWYDAWTKGMDFVRKKTPLWSKDSDLLGKPLNGAARAIDAFIARVNERVTARPSGARQLAAGEIDSAYFGVQLVQKGLTPEEIEAFQANMKEYEELAKDYFDKSEKVSMFADIGTDPGNINHAGMLRELAIAKAKMDNAKDAAFNYSASIGVLDKSKARLSKTEAEEIGRHRLAVLDKYAMGFKSLGEASKDFFGWDFGKKGEGFLGDSKDQKDLDHYVQMFKGYRKQLTDGIESSDRGFSIKINMKSVEKEVASFKEKLDASALFGDTLDFQIKVTGLDVNKDQLAELYATDADGYKVWADAVEKMRLAKVDFDKLTKEQASPQVIAKARKDLQNATEGAKASAPKTQGFQGAIADISKLGAQAPDLKTWSFLTEDTFKNVKNELEQAIIAKNRFDTPGKRPYEQSLADIRGMVDGLQKVNAAIASARREALSRGTSQFIMPSTSSGDFSRYERSQDLSRSGQVLTPEQQADILQKFLASRPIANSYSNALLNQQMAGGSTIPDEVAQYSNSRRAWLDVDKQIADERLAFEADAVERAKKSWAEQEAAFEEHSRKLDGLTRKLARIADIFPPATNSSTTASFAGMGMPFTDQEFLNITNSPLVANKAVGEKLQGILVSQARELQVQMDKVGKDPFNLLEMKKASDMLVHYTKLGAMLYRDFAMLSPNEKLQNYGDAGFTANTPRQIKELQQNPEMLLLVEEMRNIKFQLDQKDLNPKDAEYYQRRKYEITQVEAPKYNFSKSGPEDMFKQISSIFPDLNLTADSFSKFGTTLIDLAKVVNAANFEIATLGNTEEDRIKYLRITRDLEDTRKEASRTTAQFSYTSRGEYAMRSAGVDPGTDYKYVDEVADKQLRMLSGKISSALKTYSDAERDGTYTPAARLVAALEIERMQGQLSKALALASMKPENTQAYQAGVAFASDIKSAFSDGMKELLAGKNTPAEIFAKFFDTLAVKITDTFINGAVSSMTSEGGLFDNLLKSFGTNLFSGAMKMFGGNKEKDVSVQATKDLTQAIQDLIGIYRDMTGTGAQGPGISTDANGGPNQGISFNTTGDTPSDYSTLAGSSNVYGNGAGMSFKIPKNSALSSGFGFTDTSSVSSPDLTPTLQTGFSSSVDWLKNLNQTSDSGFGKTVSTLDFLSKISSQGFGGIINMLAMTAGGAGGGLLGTALGFITKAIGVFGGPASSIASISTEAIAPISHDQLMNLLPPMATGGSIPGNFGSPVPIMAHGGEVILNPEQQRALILGGNVAGGSKREAQVFNINITGDVSLQTRQEIVKMIPQIAAGVNSQNYESGFISRR